MTESAQQRAKKPVSACVSASGSASSPVCRINEKLANRLFAGFIFVQNCSVDLMMDLTPKSQTMGDCASAQLPPLFFCYCPSVVRILSRRFPLNNVCYYVACPACETTKEDYQSLTDKKRPAQSETLFCCAIALLIHQSANS